MYLILDAKSFALLRNNPLIISMAEGTKESPVNECDLEKL